MNNFLSASRPAPARSWERASVGAGLLALALCSLGVPVSAQAEPPVLIWGFQQKGCQRMADLDHALERELFAQKRNVTLLQSPSGQPLPPCVGERCGQAVRAACPNAQGYVIGGQGQEGKVVRTRLWLYDLSSGRIAWRDDYCHTCLLSGALPEHVRALLSNPSFGSAPGSTPSYCAAAAGGTPSQQGAVFLSVFGEGKAKTPLASALRSQLEVLGRTVQPAPLEAKHYSREELAQIADAQPGSKVLLAHVFKEGTVALSLYDQKARITDGEEVKCSDCNSEALVLKVKDAVADLLGRCAGTQCGEAARNGMVLAPIAACEPWAEDTCSSSGLDALTATAPAMPGGGLNPKTARLIKGLTWGGFALTAAAGVTLFGISGAAGKNQVSQNVATTYNLDIAGWGVLGASAVLLGVAIPVTVVVDRATQPVQNASASAGPALIRCPN